MITIQTPYGPFPYASILQALKEERVMRIKRLENGDFCVREQCDEWFHVDLTPEQLHALADEIHALADSPTPTHDNPTQ